MIWTNNFRIFYCYRTLLSSEWRLNKQTCKPMEEVSRTIWISILTFKITFFLWFLLCRCVNVFPRRLGCGRDSILDRSLDSWGQRRLLGSRSWHRWLIRRDYRLSASCWRWYTIRGWCLSFVCCIFCWLSYRLCSHVIRLGVSRAFRRLARLCRKNRYRFGRWFDWCIWGRVLGCTWCKS